MTWLILTQTPDNAVTITVLSNIRTIQNKIDDKLWTSKLIGNTLFLTMNTEEEDESIRYRGNIRSLTVTQQSVLHSAKCLGQDSFQSRFVFLLDTLEAQRFSFSHVQNENTWYFRSLPVLPPR